MRIGQQAPGTPGAFQMVRSEGVKKGPGGVIATVGQGSLAARYKLQPGDRLLAINDHPLRDIIDVQYYGAEEALNLLLERKGQQVRLAVERDYDEDLGLTFENPTFDGDIRHCANNCEFCFVKQNAPGMRRSLYIKDDDYRYSFLFGNFVTLTNLTDDDWLRLKEQRLSPLYVSVHATELELRRRFLSRKNAPDVMDQLQRLDARGIEVHTQVVLVPGLNDGANLVRTVQDLATLYGRPVASVGVVPVGLTKYHRGQCRTYAPEESRAVLDQIDAWQVAYRRQHDRGLVYPSDEWYLLAGREVPAADDYDGFPQVENGVGMVRQLLDEWLELQDELPPTKPKSATLVCGRLIAPVLGQIVEEWSNLTGSSLRLVPVTNEYFGRVTTVSGLLTGQDVVTALEGVPLGEIVLLPRAMFTGSYGAGSMPPGVTLDDRTIADLSRQLSLTQPGVRVEMAGTLTEAMKVLAWDGLGTIVA
jgi:putative radical SAM enzyme (TIGR03279 family)